jgi:very-short-patch-repair endonuclease
VTWELSTVKAIVKLYGATEFNRQMIITDALGRIVEQTNSVGKTPDATLSRVMQSVRDCGVLKFVSKGRYKLLDIQKSHEADRKMSKGEKLVKLQLELLKVYNVEFIQEKVFPDLRDVGHLRMDFVVYKDDETYVIEFDGGQHHKPVERFGGFKSFLRTKYHDRLKDFYCKERGIKMLRLDKLNIFDVERQIKTLLNIT